MKSCRPPSGAAIRDDDGESDYARREVIIINGTLHLFHHLLPHYDLTQQQWQWQVDLRAACGKDYNDAIKVLA